jgi:hypothetical protein
MIKSMIYFFVSFLVLTLPFGRGTLFDTLYDKTAPVLSPTYNSISRAFKQASDLITDAIGDAFSTAPKKQLDIIKARMSSTNKPAAASKVDREMEQIIKNMKKDTPADEDTEEERDMLRKIIRETQY